MPLFFRENQEVSAPPSSVSPCLVQSELGQAPKASAHCAALLRAAKLPTTSTARGCCGVAFLSPRFQVMMMASVFLLTKRRVSPHRCAPSTVSG